VIAVVLRLASALRPARENLSLLYPSVEILCDSIDYTVDSPNNDSLKGQLLFGLYQFFKSTQIITISEDKRIIVIKPISLFLNE
jgi:hypothetical protein